VLLFAIITILFTCGRAAVRRRCGRDPNSAIGPAREIADRRRGGEGARTAAAAPGERSARTRHIAAPSGTARAVHGTATATATAATPGHATAG